jgi:Ecdysteroid kinase-like family
LQIIEHAITPGSGAGDHFASIMFRVKLTYATGKATEPSKVTWIVKTMPFQEGIKKDMLQDGVIFKRESYMYTSAVVEMQRLLKQAGDNVELGPRLIYSGTTPTHVIVLEDLTERGYIVKPSPLNLEETKMIISKLAKWHATSYYMGQQHSPITELESVTFEKENPELLKLFGNSFQNLKRSLAKWPNPNESVVEKLEILSTAWYQKAIPIFMPAKPAEFSVLCHADFHFKNAMYKYHEDGRLEDILLLDFQGCHWGSPGIDVIYTLYAMASKQTRENHRDELIQHYYNLFTETLLKIGHMGRVPTMHALQLELTKCGFVEVLISSCFLPFFYIDFSKPNPDFDMTMMMDPDSGFNFFEYVYDLAEYKDDMGKLLPRFLHRGYLDV